jgi:hypothetical protein
MVQPRAKNIVFWGRRWWKFGKDVISVYKFSQFLYRFRTYIYVARVLAHISVNYEKQMVEALAWPRHIGFEVPSPGSTYVSQTNPQLWSSQTLSRLCGIAVLGWWTLEMNSWQNPSETYWVQLKKYQHLVIPVDEEDSSVWDSKQVLFSGPVQNVL